MIDGIGVLQTSLSLLVTIIKTKLKLETSIFRKIDTISESSKDRYHQLINSLMVSIFRKMKVSGFSLV